MPGGQKSTGLYAHADEANISALGAINTDILSATSGTVKKSAITPRRPHSLLRITVVLAATAVFKITETTGLTTKTHSFERGVALTANAPYMWLFGASDLRTYNFHLGTDVAIDKLQVEEISGGAS